MADTPKLNPSDRSVEAYEKINQSIDHANEAKNESSQANTTADEAKQIAESSNQKSLSTQEQLDQVVIEGDSSVEAAQARVDTDGVSHDTLKKRLDDEHSSVTTQLAETVKYVNVTKFGAKGDETTLDTQAINDAISYAETIKSGNNNPTLYFPNTEGYLVDSTITVPIFIDVLMEAPLVYQGVGVALVIGENGSSNSKTNLKLNVIKETLSDWSSEDDIGIKLINTSASKINIVRSEGFTIGLQCIGSGGGFVYNETSLGDMKDNKIAVDCTNETSLSMGWCNENLFSGGRFWCESATNTDLSRHGVRITSKDGTYVENNNNNFIKPSFELAIPNSGEAVPIIIEHGKENAFEYCRDESNSLTFARISNDSTENVFTTGYGFPSIEDNSKYPATFSRSRSKAVNDSMMNLVFDSGNLREKICFYDGDTNYNLAGMFLGTSGDANLLKSFTGYTLHENSISMSSSRCIGIRMATTNAKRFVVRRDTNASNPGRVSVRCYDENLNLLYDTGIAYVKGKSNREPYPNSAFGGTYRITSTQADFFFAVTSDVKYVDVLFSDGEITSMSIYTDSPIMTSTFNPLTNEKENLATTPPVSGTWEKGKKVYNDGTLSSGSPIGWVNTTDNGCNFLPFGSIS